MCGSLFREYTRRVFQLGPIALGLGGALFERCDLRAGTLLAFDTAVTVGGELRQSAIGELSFAHDGLLFSLNFSKFSAPAGDVVVHLRKLRFQIRSGCKRAERGLSLNACSFAIRTAPRASRPR